MFHFVLKTCFLKFLTSFCFIFVGISGVYAQPSVFNHPDESYHPHRLPGMQKVEITSVENNYDIVHQLLDLQIDPAVQYIKGMVQTSFTSENSLEEIQLNMSLVLEIDSIIWQDQHLTYTLSEPHILRVLFDSVLMPGDLQTIRIYYHGIPESSGFGSFIKSSHNSSPVLWTLSEPYGAKDWWPCKQGLEDKVDSLDMVITVPQGNKVASNGLLQSVISNGDKLTYHWKHGYPIATYLVAFAVTNYVEFTDTALLSTGPLEILNYVYPESLDQYIEESKAVIPMMELMDSLVGAYPFASEKYGHAQFSWPGGMEHQTMSFMGNFSFELLAHELAHQWFGDKVTCGTWQNIFLNEAFATYLTGVCVEHLLEPMWWDRWKTVRKDIVFEQPDGSVFVADTTDVPTIFNGRLTYTKGAYLLHMLRWVLGDEAFFEVLKRYLNDPELRYGFAIMDDFVQHAETEYGSDLDWFFNPWYYGEGHPVYKFDFTEKVNGLECHIQQSGSAPQTPFFRMPLPFLLKFSDGDSSIVIWNEQPQEEIFIPFATERVLVDIVFDPEHWILGQVSSLNSSSVNATEDLHLEVRPNPASSEILVLLTKKSNTEKMYKLLDINGKELEYFKTKDNFVRWNIDHLPAGMYLVAVEMDAGTLVQKFLK